MIDPRVRAIYYIMLDIKPIRTMLKDWEAYNKHWHARHDYIGPKGSLDYILREVSYSRSKW